mgnify:CR=1 FL=1
MRNAHFIENKRSYMEEVSAIIRQLKERSWTRRKIAKALNVHYVTVKKWEKLDACPNFSNFYELRDLLRK